MQKQKTKSKKFLKAACTAGLLCFLFFSGLLVWTSLWTKISIFGEKNELESASYFELIQRFDMLLSDVERSLPVNNEYFQNVLAKLESKAIGAEANLSVLKRYRSLAKTNGEFFLSYCSYLRHALEKFPHSALLSALDSEALIWKNLLLSTDDETIKPETQQELLRSAAVLTNNGPLSENTFFPLVFYINAMSGAFEDIESAKKINRVDDIFAAFIREIHPNKTDNAELYENIIVNAALLKTISGGIAGASAVMLPLEPKTILQQNTMRFVAEFSYDFANPLLAAEMWFKLGSQEDIARAADAFVLADDIPSAVRLWSILGMPAKTGIQSAEFRELRAQSLYNLASISKLNDKQNEQNYLQQLFLELENANEAIPCLVYGIILWSRLMDDDQVINFLQENKFTGTNDLLSLELFKRKLTTTQIDKSFADIWFLLNKFPQSEDIYTWSAWYFERMRKTDEVFELEYFAKQNNVSAPALQFSKALGFMRAQKLADAEIILRELENTYPNWALFANLGLIYEAKYEYTKALAEYQKAAQIIDKNYNSNLNAKAASVQLKIASMFGILGNKNEQRLAIERAAEYAPDDVQVRLAIKKNASPK
ncbi:MAG: hypothetical protein LBV52_00190 [Spirochaetaceae bacterium]|jgi:tetratricopeptide (TPR) repeat protein|nr:hypothetical protein [Spirochaetaceae bacterium]